MNILWLSFVEKKKQPNKKFPNRKYYLIKILSYKRWIATIQINDRSCLVVK